MRPHLFSAIILTVATSVLAAQSADQKDKDKDKAKTKTPKTLTLVGCIATDETKPGRFMMRDPKEGGMYWLSGTDVRDYLNQRVQIVGNLATTKRLQISTGLLPTPNVAAQAGAMDPAQAAVAAQSSAGTGKTVEMPELQVKSVRPVPGSCPEP